MVEEKRRMVSIGELRNDDVLDANAIATTTISFADKFTGEQKDAKVYVIRGKLNGEDVYLKVNENTTVFKQLEKYLHDNSDEPPCDLEDTFTFDVVQSQKNKMYKYQSIRELSKGIDSATADELFKE